MTPHGISLTKGPFSKRESFAKSIDSLYLQTGNRNFKIQTRFDFFATLHILLKNLCKSARKKYVKDSLNFLQYLHRRLKQRSQGSLILLFES